MDFYVKIFRKTFPFLLFSFLSIIFLRGILFSPGVIIGSDWGLPFTEQQIHEYFSNGFTTWTNQMNLLGGRQPFSVSLWFQGLMKFWAWLELSGKIFLKLWLLSLFVLGGCSMYSLIRFLKCKKEISLFGGFIFITSPIFFNYSIMGWINALFALSVFPLAILVFIKSVKESKSSYSVVAGLLYALAVIQSQSFVWYPLVFLMLSFYLIEDKKTFWLYFKSLIIVLSVGIALHLSWLIPLFLSPASSVLGSDLASNEMSKGTWVRLSYINIFRLWGSLVNYQYETSYPKSLEIFSFVVPVIVSLALLFLKKMKIVVSLVLIFLIPILLFSMGSVLIAKIPFSNIIRDVARFSILSALAYALVAALLLDFLFKSKKVYFKVLGIVLCLSAFVNSFPFFLGRLTGEPELGPDVRLRTYEFTEGNLQVESLVSGKMLDGKILYLPLGEVMELKNEAQFNGAFKGARDLFAIYSKHPGGITFYQSGIGSPQQLSIELGKMLNQGKIDKLGEFLNSLAIRRLVLRTDIEHSSIKDYQAFISSLNRQIYVDRSSNMNIGNIYIFKNNNFLPHLYTAKSSFVSRGNIKNMANIIAENSVRISRAIFFKNQNEYKDDLLEDIRGEAEGNQVLEFKKINPTKYRVKIHSAGGKFPLVFSESFHEGWKAYPMNFQFSIFNFQTNSNDQLSNYKILDGNDSDQANERELREYINRGWVTELGNMKEKEIKHKKWVDNDEELDYVEKYKIDFISKNFQDTIQNDNLPTGHFWETWFKKPLSEADHLMANGYANSWVIDAEKICAENQETCQKNDDGTYEMELVVEFWPQRLFYVGLGISGTTLLACLGYLGWDFMKRRGKSNVSTA